MESRCHHDINVVLLDIATINTKYKNQIDKFEASKRKTEDFNILLRVSIDSQTLFISKKLICRSLIALLPPDERGAPEAKLNSLQVIYRNHVARKKELFSIYDGENSVSSHPKTITSNNDYLNQAGDIETKNKEALEGAHRTMGGALQTGIGTVKVLEENREKIIAISGGLDEIDSETTMAKNRLVLIAKRFSTDKLLIAFAFLLVLAIIAIVLWRMNVF